MNEAIRYRGKVFGPGEVNEIREVIAANAERSRWGRRRSSLPSSPSWRFVVPRISYQTFGERSLPIKRIKLKSNQGDIFALQLREHNDVA